MWVGGHQGRHQDMTRTAQAFADAGFLRPGLTAEAAADLLWAVASPDTYRSFTVIRGWTTEQYEAWLEATVAATVLAP